MNKMELAKLKRKEPESIQAAMAMMAFNPAIGRTLPSGAVNKFIVSALKELPKLEGISTREEFDRFHDRWCKNLMRSIGRRCGYGSAQKAVNVLLKLYVHWSKISLNWKDLVPCLHVPLDSVIIGYFEEEFGGEFERRISPYYEDCDHDCYNLKHMTRPQYLAWVKFHRDIAGDNPPILIDVLWQIERLKQAKKASKRNKKRRNSK